MTSIDKILLNSAKFDDPQKTANFIGQFKELYKIPLFKIGLDAILTKAEIGNVEFVMEQKNSAERLHGCCISSNKSKFNKIFKVFTKELNHVIKIQTLDIHILAHEIAHALEKESKLDINKDFSTAINLDMQYVQSGHVLIQNAIRQILFKELELYDKAQHASELLARYFELLARSKEIGGYSSDFHFRYNEITSIFVNTTKWIEQVFNESLKASVRDHINILSKNIKFDAALGNFARKEKKIHLNKKPNWSNATKSIFSANEAQTKIGTSNSKKLDKNE
ncbi:MAG: hypothetical protein HON42_05940 [Alphaproteobacteria bacterium]|jgi:hypothetical protein|nr:hypothetical protein [Alphaproteobacteria bacterium]MBT5827782.1 hypothetical protein [Alphaproteobacteria bacterium]